MNDLPTWAYALFTTLVSGALSTIVGVFIKNSAQKRFEKEAEKNKKYEAAIEKDKSQKRQEEIKKIVEESIQPIMNRIDDMDKTVKNIQKDKVKEMNATVVTMRVKMMELHDNYVKRGYCDSHEKATWLELYNKYKDLGGNHFIEYVDEYRKDIEKLPDTKPTKKKVR